MPAGGDSIKRVGIVGWRGMVGSVLVQRMQEEGDLRGGGASHSLFSTSQAGRPSPVAAIDGAVLDAKDIERLAQMDCIVSCQGSGYTRSVHPRLRAGGWEGLWIDAASQLRTAPDSTLVLDCINRGMIERRLREGCRDFIGANCTVSLMMMGIWPLLRDDLVESIFVSSYQSASGAGAAGIEQLIEQMALAGAVAEEGGEPDSAEHRALRRARLVERGLLAAHSDDAAFAAPLGANLIPWIDSAMPEGGQSREEWKGAFECNAILGREGSARVAIEGVCVRVPVMRCHSQSLLMGMRRAISPEQARRSLESCAWIDVVDNNPEATARQLHPLAASGGLQIKTGRIRQAFGDGGGHWLQAFTVGDQLLWGAAEPLRRMLALWRDGG